MLRCEGGEKECGESLEEQSSRRAGRSIYLYLHDTMWCEDADRDATPCLLDHQQGPMCEAMWREKTKDFLELQALEAPPATGQSKYMAGFAWRKNGQVLEFIASDYGEAGVALSATADPGLAR